MINLTEQAAIISAVIKLKLVLKVSMVNLETQVIKVNLAIQNDENG